MDERDISESFAKQLLRALYSLDKPIGMLDSVIPDLPPGPHELVKIAIGDLMSVLLTDLMAPLYRLHPQLGSASEPGAWLGESDPIRKP